MALSQTELRQRRAGEVIALRQQLQAQVRGALDAIEAMPVSTQREASVAFHHAGFRAVYQMLGIVASTNSNHRPSEEDSRRGNGELQRAAESLLQDLLAKR